MPFFSPAVSIVVKMGSYNGEKYSDITMLNTECLKALMLPKWQNVTLTPMVIDSQHNLSHM